MFHHEDLHGADQDALAPARGLWNSVKVSVMFFWAPLAAALLLLTWWHA